jgi:hypothetical protein
LVASVYILTRVYIVQIAPHPQQNLLSDFFT